MKTLIIAEKPSQAADYKEMLEHHENQSFSKREGFYESDKYYLSWCFGHLVTLCEPQDYGWKEWVLDDLPMIPDSWQYIIKDDPGAQKQFNVLKSLLSKSDSVINGSDPDREGELIVRLVLHLSGHSNIEQIRFWNTSMAMKDLIKAWDKKESSKKYNNLYSSANCRQRADWLVGMNLSRAYSLKSNVKGISIGRVQTPTLAMVVERDSEVENWKQSFFSEIHLKWSELQFVYVGENKESASACSFVSQGELSIANEIISKSNNVSCSPESLVSINKTSNAPLMFNLADLQKLANTKLSYSADKTLGLVQSLYEKKLLSYPRTDCNYLSDEMYDDCKEILEELVKDLNIANLLTTEKPKAFNSSKITAHTAIVPVGTNINGCSEEEKSIYQLVVKRFIEGFGKPKLTTEHKVFLKIDTYYYLSTHNHVTDYGYEMIFNKKDEPSIEFPKEITGDTLSHTADVQLIQKERTKPKYYTDSTLLTALENCSKTIVDQDLRESLKAAKGIGKPATRSSIILSLQKRGYLVLKKNSLISTEKGRSLIKAVSPVIASPEMTAEWELKLALIEDGAMNWKVFYDEICEFTKSIVSDVKSQEKVSIVSPENKLFKCPKCNQETLRINKIGGMCVDDQSCKFKVFRKQFNKTLTDAALSDLLYKKKTGKIKFKSKANKQYEARLLMNDKYEVVISFDK